MGGGVRPAGCSLTVTRNLVASHDAPPQRRRTGTRNQANRPVEYTNPCGIVTPPVRICQETRAEMEPLSFFYSSVFSLKEGIWDRA